VCGAPEEWPWSSYAATAGLVPRPGFLTTTVLDWFADRDDYRRFVAAGLPDASLEERPPLAELVPTRDPARITDAHRTHGYHLAEIADHLGVHLSTIWRDVRRGESA
jgi:hypothetical protein